MNFDYCETCGQKAVITEVIEGEVETQYCSYCISCGAQNRNNRGESPKED